MSKHFWLILSVLLMLVPVSSFSAGRGALVSLPQLVGEDLEYGIDFLFFRRLAEGRLQFEETSQPDIYRVELVGRTLGIASWLAGDRTQTYSSLMQLMPDGSLSSIEHISKIKKKRWGKWTDREKVRHFDYRAGKVVEEKLKAGVIVSKAEHAIPEGVHPVDMLTAFYNLRIGVYGPLQPGNKILIPTYTGKEAGNGFAEIEVTVLTAEEQKRHGYFPAEGLLLKAVIDPEIFETDSGNLFVWFDDSGVPERGIIEDMIGLGDVRGYLEKESL